MTSNRVILHAMRAPIDTIVIKRAPRNRKCVDEPFGCGKAVGLHQADEGTGLLESKRCIYDKNDWPEPDANESVVGKPTLMAGYSGKEDFPAKVKGGRIQEDTAAQ